MHLPNLRALMVETMVNSQADLWRQVPIAVIEEFQRLPRDTCDHNLFLSSLAANHYPEAIMDVFRFFFRCHTQLTTHCS